MTFIIAVHVHEYGHSTYFFATKKNLGHAGSFYYWDTLEALIIPHLHSDFDPHSDEYILIETFSEKQIKSPKVI